MAWLLLQWWLFSMFAHLQDFQFLLATMLRLCILVGSSCRHGCKAPLFLVPFWHDRGKMAKCRCPIQMWCIVWFCLVETVFMLGMLHETSPLYLWKQSLHHEGWFLKLLVPQEIKRNWPRCKFQIQWSSYDDWLECRYAGCGFQVAKSMAKVVRSISVKCHCVSDFRRMALPWLVFDIDGLMLSFGVYLLLSMKIRDSQKMDKHNLIERFCLQSFHATMIFAASVQLLILNGIVHVWHVLGCQRVLLCLHISM